MLHKSVEEDKPSHEGQEQIGCYFAFVQHFNLQLTNFKTMLTPNHNQRNNLQCRLAGDQRQANECTHGGVLTGMYR
jgi:hypothetical protein